MHNICNVSQARYYSYNTYYAYWIKKVKQTSNIALGIPKYIMFDFWGAGPELKKVKPTSHLQNEIIPHRNDDSFTKINKDGSW